MLKSRKILALTGLLTLLAPECIAPTMAADYTITIDDSLVAGITWEREQHNRVLPRSTPAIDSDEAYVQYRLGLLAADAVRRKSEIDRRDALAAAEAGDLSKLDALRASFDAKAAKRTP